MRFMMLILPAGYASAAPDHRPDLKSIETMMSYNKSLCEAGVLLALDGLHPASTGARITTVEGKVKVSDGPFTEAGFREMPLITSLLTRCTTGKAQVIGTSWSISDQRSCSE